MSYRLDNYDDSIVLSGTEKGIADSPYAGISDMRNVNITTIPGEVSVNFATASVTPPILTNVAITGLSSNVFSFASTPTLDGSMAIYFNSVSGLSGVSINTAYFIGNVTATSFKVYTDPFLGTLVTVTGTPSGVTFSTYNIGTPAYFARDEIRQKYYMQDTLGQVWSNQKLTATNHYWTYTGNSGSSDTGGYGLIYYNGYLFAFRSQTIDVYNLSTNGWAWGWNPNDGTTNNSSTTFHLKTGGNHSGSWMPDGTMYFLDGGWVQTIFQTLAQIIAGAFNPFSTSTYTYTNYQLTFTDGLQCMTFLGSTLLLGGTKNIIYVWDRASQTPSNFVLLPENYVYQMVTVNTTVYAFVGNRGRIYQTNGTNAQLYKKIPDHISGTVEPYFNWGGLVYNKNRLYFGVSAVTNAGVAINQYGGVWTIDLDTEAMWLSNELSYGNYGGLANALIANTTSEPAGAGLFIGWSTTSINGIDQTTSTPYTSGATIDYDLIPIGTFNMPRNLNRIEFKLSRPLGTGESIVLKTRTIFNTQDVGYSTALSVNGDGVLYSGEGSLNFENAQWLQVQAVLSSTNSNPSYVRLEEIRLLGMVGPTLATSQNLSL